MLWARAILPKYSRRTKEQLHKVWKLYGNYSGSWVRCHHDGRDHRQKMLLDFGWDIGSYEELYHGTNDRKHQQLKLRTQSQEVTKTAYGHGVA